jgi:flagellar motor switch/type III secretory pathway protein FliN
MSKMTNDIKSAAQSQIHYPAWIRPIDPLSARLNRLIERYQFRLKSLGELSEYDFYIEKAEETKIKKIPFSISTQVGEIWIKDYDLFFGALTGIPIDANEVRIIERRIVLALASFPVEIKKLFGWITPNFASTMPENLVSLRFRLQAPDCDVATIAYASHNTWYQLLDNKKLELIEYLANTKLPTKRYLRLGHSHLTRGDIKALKIGDLLRLDVCEFDSNGQGQVQISHRLFNTAWIERGLTDVFKIINEVSMMNKSQNINDEYDGNDDGYSDADADETAANMNQANDSSVVDFETQKQHRNHSTREPANYSSMADYLATTNHDGSPTKLHSTNELPIKIDVYVGSFAMNGKEVSELRPGDLIRVDPDYRNRVSLQVNNAEIGVGEIVSLDGEVAIQMVRIWGNS